MKCKKHHKLEICASSSCQSHFLYIGKLETIDTGSKCKYLTLEMHGFKGLLQVEIIICISINF